MTRERLAGLTAEAAAALWLVHQDAEGLAEAGLFEEWLAESDDNRRAWAAAASGWALFDDASDPLLDRFRVAALESVARPTMAEKIRAWVPYAAAACLFLVVAGGLWTQWRPQATVTAAGDEADTVRAQFSSPAGHRLKVTLPDGSAVTLDGETRMAIAFDAGARHVTLSEGRALFSVAKDRARPFTVAALTRSVTAVGTRFDVSLYNGAIGVRLYQGHVRIGGAGHAAVILEPGQQIEMRAARNDIVSNQASAAEAFWTEGVVQFDNVTLAKAIEEVNRSSPVKLVLADRRTAMLRLSGRFHARDGARFARAVAEVLPVIATRTSASRIELRYR